MTTPFLRSFRLKHFKAVRDSGVIRFSPLTVFIGNNGSGKSSITEALETLRKLMVLPSETEWVEFKEANKQGRPVIIRSGLR